MKKPAAAERGTASTRDSPRGPRAEAPADAGARPRPRAGRPRLDPEELRSRIAVYCRRYGVVANEAGLPPFPSGRRESAQHREWMSLYKAQRRLSERAGAGDPVRRQELLSIQRGRCPVCQKPLGLAEARLDERTADPGVLHAQCLELLTLARRLGPEALERLRERL